MPEAPSRDEVLSYFDTLSNWGRWGPPLRFEAGTGSPANPIATLRARPPGLSRSSPTPHPL